MVELLFVVNSDFVHTQVSMLSLNVVTLNETKQWKSRELNCSHNIHKYISLREKDWANIEEIIFILFNV